MKKNIPFSPPDITESEINAVVKVLKSGWITSGEVNKEFEEELSKYIEVKKVKVKKKDLKKSKNIKCPQ